MHVDGVWRLCCVCMSEQGFVAKRGMCLLTFCKLNHPLVMCVDSMWRLCRSGSSSTVRGDGWGEFPACLVTYRHVLYYKAVTYSTLSLNHPLVMCVDSVWRLCRSGSGSTVLREGKFPACLCSLSTHNHPVAMCVDSVWRLCRSGWIFTAVGAEDAPARAWQSTVKTPSFLVGRMAV